MRRESRAPYVRDAGQSRPRGVRLSRWSPRHRGCVWHGAPKARRRDRRLARDDLFPEYRLRARVEDTARRWLLNTAATTREGQRRWGRRGVFVCVGLDQALDPFDDPVHIGRQRRRGRLRTTKGASIFWSRILYRLSNVVALDVRRRRQRMVMTRRAGKELRWQPVLLVDERFFVFVVHQSDGDFLQQVLGDGPSNKRGLNAYVAHDEVQPVNYKLTDSV